MSVERFSAGARPAPARVKNEVPRRELYGLRTPPSLRPKAEMLPTAPVLRSLPFGHFAIDLGDDRRRRGAVLWRGPPGSRDRCKAKFTLSFASLIAVDLMAAAGNLRDRTTHIW